MTKNVLVPVAEGTEDLEAVAIIDVLRRAEARVTVASVTKNRRVAFSRGLVIQADTLLEDCMHHDYDLVVLPGGIPGAQNLRDSVNLVNLLKRQRNSGLFYGAICASPAVVLEHHGLLEGRQATCHPAFLEHLSNKDRAASRVVVDGNCITSQGAGTAVEFSLALVELLFGKEKRDEVASGMAL